MFRITQNQNPLGGIVEFRAFYTQRFMREEFQPDETSNYALEISRRKKKKHIKNTVISTKQSKTFPNIYINEPKHIRDSFSKTPRALIYTHVS